MVAFSLHFRRIQSEWCLGISRVGRSNHQGILIEYLHSSPFIYEDIDHIGPWFYIFTGIRDDVALSSLSYFLVCNTDHFHIKKCKMLFPFKENVKISLSSDFELPQYYLFVSKCFLAIKFKKVETWKFSVHTSLLLAKKTHKLISEKEFRYQIQQDNTYTQPAVRAGETDEGNEQNSQRLSSSSHNKLVGAAIKTRLN